MQEIEVHKIASPDPRHRSFHLTHPATPLAEEGMTTPVASGWVRLVESDGTPVAIDMTSIKQVVGPYQIEGRWVVRLLTPERPTEPVGFDDHDGATQFVEDLLHDN